MSLVGPRPLPVAQHRRLDDWHKKRYRVSPGLTGEWQLTLHKASLDEMAHVEFAYIANWTLARDVAILMRTPFAAVRLAYVEKRSSGPKAAPGEASASVEASA
jgi:lipopolysaccharide/colanic/teichoic acid biosynthesis glycosyltransferase